MSLVAEYGSGSDSDSGSKADNGETRDMDAQDCAMAHKETEKSDESCGEMKGDSKGINNVQGNNPVKLPSASSVMERKVCSETSVMLNVYKKNEESKTKTLEQHVKMVANTNSAPVNGKINGKVVCWMYRRGRCRLGKKCKMYHDSELRAAEVKQNEKSDNKPAEAPIYTPSPQKRTLDETLPEDNDGDGPKNKIHKKRFGLTDDLVPPKKVIQHLHKINQESQAGH